MAIKRITTNLIKDSDIATVDIANNAITAAKITDGNITTAKLADLSVTAGKLAGTLDLTGKTITVATATTGDNDTSPASTAFVQQEIAALVDSSPDSLNTLNELAAALGDDASFSTTVTNSIATKLPLAGGTLTGALVVTADANPALEISRGSANTTNVNLKYNTTLTGQLSAANAEFQISAAGSSTPMEFFTNGSERMRIDSSGNLGLGTNSPNSYSNQTTLTINGATYGRLDIESSNTLRASLFATAGSATLYTTTGVLSFDTSGGEAMRIDANGQVMISHTSSFAHSDADNLAIGDGTNNSGLTIYTGASKESSIIFGNAGTNGNIEAGIKYYHESHGTVANRRAMTFATGGSMAERMRIDSSGDVLIGSSTNLNVLNGTPKIQVGDGSGHASIQWYSGTGSVAGLYFGDASSGSARYEGYIEYRHNSNQMAFRTQGNDVFYINSTGHVGVGTSNADARLTVNGSANSEQMIITGNGNVSRGLSISTAATGGQQDATVIFNAQDTENVAYPAMKFQTGGGDILRFHHQSIINNARVGLTYPCELMFNGEYTAGQQDVALEAGHAARIEFLKDDFLEYKVVQVYQQEQVFLMQIS